MGDDLMQEEYYLPIINQKKIGLRLNVKYVIDLKLIIPPLLHYPHFALPLRAKLSSSRKLAEDVTHKDLANNAEKLPAPLLTLHLVPLQYIITGSLQGHGMHLCLAPRLWNKHFHPDIHEQDTKFTCADGCSEELSADSEMDFVNPNIESSALFPPIASGSRGNVPVMVTGTYGIIFHTSLLMDLEMLPISPIILLCLISNYTTAIASSFTTTVAPIGSKRLCRWPPSYVTNTATGQLELSISPATVQIEQLRHLPETALAELGHRLQCQTFFGNQIARDTPDHVIYSSMHQAFDCLIGDNVTLHEHIGAQDTPSSIIGGIFGGRILSSAEQVIRLLAINVTPIGSSNDIIIARFKLHLERYIRGSGTPTLHDGSNLFSAGSLEDDPLLRARVFLREFISTQCFYTIDSPIGPGMHTHRRARHPS
ncbi:hypothetical protein EDD22DRAFT_847217 [Suillus occidentalis]|nr:hypothetical protein EDD22DRAFT_847217 [Suillus occidentalis]